MNAQSFVLIYEIRRSYTRSLSFDHWIEFQLILYCQMHCEKRNTEQTKKRFFFLLLLNLSNESSSFFFCVRSPLVFCFLDMQRCTFEMFFCVAILLTIKNSIKQQTLFPPLRSDEISTTSWTIIFYFLLPFEQNDNDFRWYHHENWFYSLDSCWLHVERTNSIDVGEADTIIIVGTLTTAGHSTCWWKWI